MKTRLLALALALALAPGLGGSKAADEMVITFGIDIQNPTRNEYGQLATRQYSIDKPEPGFIVFEPVATTNAWTDKLTFPVTSFGGKYVVVRSHFTNTSVTVYGSLDNGTTTNFIFMADDLAFFPLVDNSAVSNLVFKTSTNSAIRLNVVVFNNMASP